MARRKGKHGGDEVEKLSGRCRQLATALREWLDAPGGQLRAKDKLFLRSVADRLDDLANDVTRDFNQGKPSQVRHLATWASLGFSALGAGAGMFSAAKDAYDWGDETAPEFVVDDACLPPHIVTLAAEGFGMANVVINLPDDALRPRPRAVDLEIDDLTSTSTLDEVRVDTEHAESASGEIDVTLNPVIVEAVGSRDAEAQPETVTATARAHDPTVRITESNRPTTRTDYQEEVWADEPDGDDRPPQEQP